MKVFDLWQNEEEMIKSEDERLSSEQEDNEEQVGHQILFWWIRYFLWEGFYLITNVKNACQPFHVECQVLVTSKINISLIYLLYNSEWTLNNKDRSKFNKKVQEAIKIKSTGVVSLM